MLLFAQIGQDGAKNFVIMAGREINGLPGCSQSRRQICARDILYQNAEQALVKLLPEVEFLLAPI
ncbi:MAG TPA: hypothetical protein VKP67_20395 [Xanthobacteraceae bacterium]|nr:hypothetical protein [Xanthobacteraceae bacterium]